MAKIVVKSFFRTQEFNSRFEFNPMSFDALFLFLISAFSVFVYSIELPVENPILIKGIMVSIGSIFVLGLICSISALPRAGKSEKLNDSNIVVANFKYYILLCSGLIILSFFIQRLIS